jgi:hypothetical protein
MKTSNTKWQYQNIADIVDITSISTFLLTFNNEEFALFEEKKVSNKNNIRTELESFGFVEDENYRKKSKSRKMTNSGLPEHKKTKLVQKIFNCKTKGCGAVVHVGESRKFSKGLFSPLLYRTLHADGCLQNKKVEPVRNVEIGEEILLTEEENQDNEITLDESIQPADLSFNTLKSWSLKHVAKYGTPKRKRTKSHEERVRQFIYGGTSLKAQEPAMVKSSKPLNACIPVRRADLAISANLNNFTKFKAKLRKHEAKQKRLKAKKAYNEMQTLSTGSAMESIVVQKVSIGATSFYNIKK